MSRNAPQQQEKQGYSREDDPLLSEDPTCIGRVQNSVGGKRSFTTILSVLGLLVLVLVILAVIGEFRNDDDDDNNNNNNNNNNAHPYSTFFADPQRPSYYTSGQRRRATDPVSTEEIDAVNAFLFGTQPIASLAVSAALENNPAGLAAFRAVLPVPARLVPAHLRTASRVPAAYSPFDAEELFMEKLTGEFGGSVDAAVAWLHSTEDVFSSMRWNSLNHISTFVSDAYKQEIIDAEYSIESGDIPIFHRLLAVSYSSGVTDYDAATGDVYRARVDLVIDTTDINNLVAVPALTEVVKEYMGNAKSALPDYAPPSSADQAYLISLSQALYGPDAEGNDRVYIPYCGTMPSQIDCPTRQWSGSQKFFVQPFRWAQGNDAVMYGRLRNETIMSAVLIQYGPSMIPIDTHAIDTGSDLFSSPLTLVYSAYYDMVDPLNLLADSQAIALTWYGRGLSFSAATSAKIAAAVKYTVHENCPRPVTPTLAEEVGYHAPGLPGRHQPPPRRCVVVDTKQTDYRVLRAAIVDAIAAAWGTDQVFGLRPGVLVPGPQGDLVPEPVANHPYDTPTYIQHTTASVVEEALGHHRDIRDNLPEMRPLTNPSGGINPLPLGKRLDFIFPDGRSFELDGYKVTYTVGLTWKMQIGFIDQAGLTLFNIRLVLPPTDAHPEGEEVPYLWKLNIPRFGTTYQNSAYGTLFAANFLEDHYGLVADVVPGANCRGSYLTLPLFAASGLDPSQRYSNAPNAYYTTYGDPTVTDPYAELLLGLKLPYNSYPMTQQTRSGRVIQSGICLQEMDFGEGMWHFYSSQRLRSLQIFTSTVSDAYNVVNTFEFFSNGRLKVTDKYHGKPAIMGHGIPVAGGNYASAGRGSFGSNHMHWALVGIHPHLKQYSGEPNIINRVLVSDLAMNTDEGNWYGTHYVRSHIPINTTGDSASMTYQFDTNRAWLVEAFDNDTQTALGALKITSNSFGPPPMTSLYQYPLRYNETDFTEDDTIMANWWLLRNIWILNGDIDTDGPAPSNSGRLIPDPVSAEGGCKVGLSARRCVANVDEPIGDDPAVYVVMKVYHGVTTEEMPVQNGFTEVFCDIWPHNLFTFNPNMLVRQQPLYAAKWQNPPDNDKIYVLPYADEF